VDASGVPDATGMPESGPMEIWELSATRVNAAIRVGAISAREAVEASLARIDVHNGELNALVEVSGEEALAAADAADAAQAGGAPLGPLHGVPLAVKANTDQAGHATTNGVVAWRDRIADRDAPHIARLRAAGAIVVGRSNTPAFSMRWCADNDLHGRTNNPWDAARTPGGSSGGAGSALASGMVSVAQGNDYGGSIRYPAHACGVTGLRPTVGIVPRAIGVSGGPDRVSWQLMAVEGPLARTVGDLRVALAAMGGAHPRDPFSVPFSPVPGPPGGVRIGLVRDPGVVAPSPAVDAALDTAAGWLRDAGHTVQEVDLPLLVEAYRLWYLLCIEDNRGDLPLIAELGGEGAHRSLLTQLAVARQWWPEQPALLDVLEGYERRGAVVRALHEVLEDMPVLLMPVSAEQAFAHGEDIASDADAIRLADAQWSCMAIPLLGVPAVSVPVAVSGGLPVGVQLVGGRFREELLLGVAEDIEARAEVPSPIEPYAR
jgi:amidase